MITLNKILEYIEYSTIDFKCFVIDDDGLDHPIDKNKAVFYIAENIKTVKIEDLERVTNEFCPNTVHCFISPEGAKSFGVHEDTCDVTIYCIEGTKTMNVNGEQMIIAEGEHIFIPQGTPHEATNLHRSVILSVGK
jgi:mannose-6-phosphate isomerase-like protein (cupin superfamily)